MAETKPTYLNGFFVKKVQGVAHTGEEYEFFKIGVKKQDFIDQLKNLKEDERGFVNFKMNQQKNDPLKYSITVDTWRPINAVINQPNSAKPAVISSGEDTLPF